MTFAAWKYALISDARQIDSIRKTNFAKSVGNISDFVLRILYDDGIGPTVEDILAEGSAVAA
jgi:hypothetical protein